MIFGENKDPREGYWFAQDQWAREQADPDFVELHNPRDVYGAIEETLVRGFDHHPIEAKYIIGLAFDSVQRGDKPKTR